MKIDLQFGSGVISLPEKTLEILGSASAVEMKLLILLASDKSLRESFSYEEAAVALSINVGEIAPALNYLCDSGLISLGDASRAADVSVRVKNSGDARVTVVRAGGDIPSYTGPEIKELFSRRGELSGLVDQCQRILGKMLTLLEINRIISLADYYRLDAQYIKTLCEYAVKIGKPSVPYIDKTARSFYEQGIVTLDALENKIRRLEELSTLEGFVRKLFGMGERALTSSEKKFIEQWSQYEYPSDMIELAYEISVNNTESKTPSMPYMNKVLTNWREAGHKTTEEVVISIDKYRSSKNAQSTPKLSGKGKHDPVEEAIILGSQGRIKKFLDDELK